MTYTKERLEELGFGYDLDCGGYEFTEISPSIDGISGALDATDTHFVDWDDDLSAIVRDLSPRRLHMIIFVPEGGSDWPDSFDDEDGNTFNLEYGPRNLNTTDHDCHCHGRLVEWTGAAGEPSQPQELTAKYLEAVKLAGNEPYTRGKKFFWEPSGNTSDLPYPDCNRCEGDGTVESVGGEYALYVQEDDDDDE